MDQEKAMEMYRECLTGKRRGCVTVLSRAMQELRFSRARLKHDIQVVNAVSALENQLTQTLPAKAAKAAVKQLIDLKRAYRYLFPGVSLA